MYELISWIFFVEKFITNMNVLLGGYGTIGIFNSHKLSPVKRVCNSRSLQYATLLPTVNGSWEKESALFKTEQ